MWIVALGKVRGKGRGPNPDKDAPQARGTLKSSDYKAGHG